MAIANFTVSSTTSSTSSAIQVLNTIASSGPGVALAAGGSGTTVTISPPVSASLGALSCSPTSLTVPASSQCTVGLSAPAPSAGVNVLLGWTATAAAVSMPTSVAIAGGGTSALFTVQVSSATASTTVQVSASLNSATLTSTINVAPAPPVAVAVSPAGVTLAPGGTQQFSATVTGTTNTAVTWSLSSAVGSISSAGLYTAPASVSSQQTVTVRATSAADTIKYATASVVVNPPPPASTNTVSFWPTTATPAHASASDTNPVELGLTFSSGVAGAVTGVRFYKGTNNTGTHTGHLWTSTGTLLGSVTFSNETASGWQQANFATPINIAANTVYVISYFAPKGAYSYNQSYSWSGLSAAPLSVSGTSPGVYTYASTSSLPVSAYKSTNYWVDVVFAAGTTASVAVVVSPSSVTLGPGGTQQFTASVSGTSNTSVTWSLSPAVGTISSSGLYTAPSSVSSQQTVTVRTTSAADTTKYATAAVVVNLPAPISFWPTTATPGTVSDPDTSSVELGLKFSSSVAGTVTGVRFYKGPNNTGTHVGHLWSSSGTLLASVTFANETPSGWQQANFSTPVTITANTVYVISYLAPNGCYADDQSYAWATLSAAPLAVSGNAPGVYSYGSTATFPINTWNASNYWVDVVFVRAQ